MTGGRHTDRIIQLLSERSGLDDDEIAGVLNIEPRQTVNQICRRLAASAVLWRERGPSGKIVNSIIGERSVPVLAPRRPQYTPESTAPEQRFDGPFIPRDFAKTLLIIPCSGAKRDYRDAGEAGVRITQFLPDRLAAELHKARQRVKTLVPFDDRRLVPACQRYDGALYRTGRGALADLMAAGMHAIIISGGYGAVLAQEPIGRYEARLNQSWWPNHLIERVLIAYAQRQGMASVRAFVSATGPYVTILKRVRWRDAGINDALVLTPKAEPAACAEAPRRKGKPSPRCVVGRSLVRGVARIALASMRTAPESGRRSLVRRSKRHAVIAPPGWWGGDFCIPWACPGRPINFLARIIKQGIPVAPTSRSDPF